jgi:hypothetical protein
MNQVTNETQPEKDTAQPVPKGRHRFQAKLGIAGIVLLVVLAGAFYYLNHKTHAPHIYGDSKQYKFSGPVKGEGMVFNQPANFVDSLGSNKFYQILAYQTQDNEPETKDTITLLVAPYAHSTEEELNAVNANIVKVENSSDYQNIIMPIQATTRLTVYNKTKSNDYITTLSKAQPFRSPNIGSNAWEFSIRSDDVKNKKLQELQGWGVYAYGQKAIYIFEIITTKQNYDANLKLWQQTITSLKIDQ